MKTSKVLLVVLLGLACASSLQAQSFLLSDTKMRTSSTGTTIATLPGMLVGTSLTTTSSTVSFPVMIASVVVGMDEDSTTSSSTVNSK